MKEKAVVIIGNGFDIKCKYYTRYINFKHFVEKWNFIKNNVKIRKGDRESSVSGTCDYIDKIYENDIDFFITNLNLVTLYNQDVISIDKIFHKENVLCKFLFLTQNEDALWSDIEKTLENLLMSLYKFFKLIEKCRKNNIKSISEKYININCENDNLFEYLYYDSLRDKKYCSFELSNEERLIRLEKNIVGTEDEIELLDNLYNNLNDLKKAFSIYLYVYVCELNNSKFIYGNYESDYKLISDLTKKISEYDCDIVSFNYTHSHKEILSLQPENKRVHYIHNTCENIRNGDIFKWPEIVIGITDNLFKDNVIYNRFEKTIQINNFDKLSKIKYLIDCAQQYIVYGHSFAGNDKHIFSDIFNNIINKNKKMDIFYCSQNDLYNKVRNIKTFFKSIDDFNDLILQKKINFIPQSS